MNADVGRILAIGATKERTKGRATKAVTKGSQRTNPATERLCTARGTVSQSMKLTGVTGRIPCFNELLQARLPIRHQHRPAAEIDELTDCCPGRLTSV